MEDAAYPVGSQTTESLRIPPHSDEAEQAVLGGLVLDNEAWDQVADRVAETDFYRHDHRLIFIAIRALADESAPFDVVTVSERLARDNALEDAGGLAYLGTLARNTPSAANIQAYARIIREHAILRELIHAGTRIGDSAYQPDGRSTTDLVDEAERLVFDIAEKGARGRQGFLGMSELLERTVERIEELIETGGEISGLPCGFSDIDRKTGGLQKSDLIIVAARPSMGKTTFAMNIAETAAIKHKQPVAVFSMEMSADQLTMRLLSSLGQIEQGRLRGGRLDDTDWSRLTSAMSILRDAPIFVDDTPALTPTDLRARCRRLKREQGDLGLVVVDYLQLMQSPNGARENRTNEISEISRGLKALAREMDVPVIALSQLNRALEQRPNKRPVMSDLRESGAIEQDADVIMFIYRDEVYDEDSDYKGLAEVILGKQRNGPTGMEMLVFQGEYTRFRNYSRGDSEDRG
ncbi:MAG: replicative DNA helicase [Pseudomonadota bacterium]